MKHIHILVSITLFSITTTSFSQKIKTDANLIGDVQCNGEHVPFINITLDGTTIGTTTDATGHYQLTNIPEGNYIVRVSGVGYKSTTKKFEAIKNITSEIKFVVEEDLLKLEEVVVSADRNNSNRKEAPVVITSISPKLLEQTQSSNLADGLCFTPGLRTECNCSNCGFVQLKMNGLDGPYTQILLNSRPVFSGLAGVYGLELIPTNMIERLEVVRGGGSALFGGNAIAGNVNIITKEPTRNTFSVDGSYGIVGIIPSDEEGSKSGKPVADAQLKVNAGIVSSNSKTGAYIYGVIRELEPFDENGDGYSEKVLINNSTFGFSLYHKPGSKSKITLDGYSINEFRRGGNKFEYLPHEADIAEQVRHKIIGGNLSFDKFINGNYDKFTAYVSGQTVDRESYYGVNQDPNAYGHTNDLTTSIGTQYIKNADKFLFAPSSTIFGIDNNNNIINDRKLGANGDENTTISNQLVNTFGAFIQHDWKSSKVNVSLGIRYDDYLVRDLNSIIEDRAEDHTGKAFLPRVGLLYKISPQVRLRGGYAQGYRAPQVFNEDLHIELVNARRLINVNEPDLRQETSHAFTLSLNTDFTLGESVSNLLVEGFYTKLEDAFVHNFYADSAETDVYYNERINSDNGAVVYGVNFEYGIHFSRAIDANAGFTIQRSKYEDLYEWGNEAGSVTTSYLRSPDLYGFATINWEITKKWETSLTASYTGSMFTPHFGGNITNQNDLNNMLTMISDKQLEITSAGSYTEIQSLQSEYNELESIYNDAIGINNAISSGDIIEGERLEKTEDFLIFDILVAYNFKLSNETNLKVYAGVKNIFNQTQKFHDSGKYRDAGYIYGPCQPTSINFGVKIGNF